MMLVVFMYLHVCIKIDKCINICMYISDVNIYDECVNNMTLYV